MKRTDFYNSIIENNELYRGKLYINDFKTNINVIKITNLWEKYLNLIKLKQYPSQVCFWFAGKKAINTWFFNFPVVVAFVNNDRKIDEVIKLKKNKYSLYNKNAICCFMFEVKIKQQVSLKNNTIKIGH